MLSDPDVTNRVTTRHLLNHTSGIDGDVFHDADRGDDGRCAYHDVYVEEDEDEDDDEPRFVPAAPPNRAELYVLTERVALRGLTWLRKCGYSKEDTHESNAAPSRGFAETLALVATQRGPLENVKDDTGE